MPPDRGNSSPNCFVEYETASRLSLRPRGRSANPFAGLSGQLKGMTPWRNAPSSSSKIYPI